MPVLAAVDIGSNSCRVKIAAVVEHRLQTVYEDREVVRLGESVFQTGMLSPDAMDRTLKALKRFHKAVQTHAADRVRVVATSAMRDARNARAFVEMVRAETGWEVEVISGLEEGQLIHVGVVDGEPGADGACLLIDLGGGSCEVTYSEAGQVKAMVSLPLGAVRLQGFLETDPPSADDVQRLEHFIERELQVGERTLGRPRVTDVIATSGTAAALAEASAVLAPAKGAAKRKTGKGLEVSTAHVRQLAERLKGMSSAERAAVPGIGPKRSEIIVGGALVYASLLERLELGGFRYSAFGLRDGLLTQMLAEFDQATPEHRRLEAQRWAGVLEVCRRYGVEEAVAEPVRAHALQLFRALDGVHGMPAEYGLWLQAAAMMRDVGKFMNHQGHYRHTHYILANSEIFGFSPEQRAVVAAISRFGGRSLPDAKDQEMRAVPAAEHAHVMRAVALLRLAAALNRDRVTAPLKLGVQVYPKRVLLELGPAKAGAALEAWALRREAGYFRDVFRRELFVEEL